MPAAATFSFPLGPDARAALLEVLRGGAFRDVPVPPYAEAGLALVQDGDEFTRIVVEFVADLLHLADGLAG